MRDKYTLADRFALVIDMLSPQTAAEDIQTFENLKVIRDKLIHGEDISDQSLPWIPQRLS